MTHQKAQLLVKNLYQAVDSKNVDYLNDNLSQRIRFRIGNSPAANNKKTILDANRQFFSSVHSMKHTIEEVVSQIVNKEGRAVDKIVCYGRVDYVRLDSTEHSAVFSTVLEVEDNLITDYLVLPIFLDYLLSRSL